MDNKIRKILDLAIRAPSGDNCQPWEFSLRGQVLELFNLPERDSSLYNYEQQASLVAHGALLENIQIAASALSLQSDLELFPDPEKQNLIARITLTKGNVASDPLFPAIAQRVTNRKLYQGGSLSDLERNSLLSAADSIGGAKVYLVESRAHIASLAKIVRLNDQLVFENRNLHEFLFEHIRWNDQEAATTCDGLDVKTLELNPFDRMGLKLLKSWSLVVKLNNIGLSKIISKQGEKLAKSASAIGLVAVRKWSHQDLICCGRYMQRMWLEATNLGLSFQLMTGVPLLMQRVAHGSNSGLLPKHETLIQKEYENNLPFLGVDKKNIVLLFRIGRSAPPTVMSQRMPLEKILAS